VGNVPKCLGLVDHVRSRCDVDLWSAFDLKIWLVHLCL